jgi:hypothetical protein
MGSFPSKQERVRIHSKTKIIEEKDEKEHITKNDDDDDDEYAIEYSELRNLYLRLYARKDVRKLILSNPIAINFEIFQYLDDIYYENNEIEVWRTRYHALIAEKRWKDQVDGEVYTIEQLCTINVRLMNNLSKLKELVLLHKWQYMMLME